MVPYYLFKFHTQFHTGILGPNTCLGSLIIIHIYAFTFDRAHILQKLWISFLFHTTISDDFTII